MKQIEISLQKFQTISLKEMDNVKLFDRVDTKFICGISILPEILDDISKDYYILDIDGIKRMTYKTNYFDTAGFKMYNEHQNGKLNRFKIREREYMDSSIKFLEVKFRNNKGRTIKSRILRSESKDPFTNNEIIFLHNNSPFSPAELEPKICNGYNRITLTNQVERITVDFNLNFNCAQGDSISIPALVIIEIKQKRFSLDSPVISILKKHNIRSNGFSKYCMGSLMLYNGLRSNNFKSKIQLINKLST